MKALISTLILSVPILAQAAQEPPAAGDSTSQAREFNIPATDLVTALKTYAQITGEQIVFFSEVTKNQKTSGLTGTYTPETALNTLLKSTNLTHERLNPTTIAITSKKAASSRGALNTQTPGKGLMKVAQESAGAARGSETESYKATANAPGSDAGRDESSGVPEILVKSSRTLNADIRRTEDDAQPYVVYSGEEIRASGALNLTEFFRQRLPMNAQATGSMDGMLAGVLTGGVGTLNLRGLGTNQTLILVDGRRVPGISISFDIGQPNINGISIAAIERIEILPSTAGGIYGGGATGGVINIIMKRDFAGLEASALYGNTSDTAAGRMELNLNGGFTWGGTRLAVSARHTEQESLENSERDFGRRAFDLFKTNNPDPYFLPYLAFGPTPNVLSATGENLVLDSAYGGTALNSPWTYVPTDYAGPASDGAAGLRNNAGQLRVTGQPADLYSGPTIDSVSLDIRRDLTSKLEAFVNLYWDRSVNTFSTPYNATVTLPAADASNPFQQDIVVTLPLPELSVGSRGEVETRRGNAGLIARLPFNWSGTLEYGWSNSHTVNMTGFISDPTFGFNPALQAAALRDLNATPIPNVQSLFDTYTQGYPDISTSLEDISLRASGPVAQLPGGALTLSGLLESRRQSYDDFFRVSQRQGSAAAYSWSPDGEQTVDSGYLELRAPLIKQLELMASARYDKYTTRWAAQQVGVVSPDGPFPPQTYAESQIDSTDYTVGLRYSPVEDITLRASFGTGFVPPAFSNIKPTINNYPSANLTSFRDPRRGGGRLTGDPSTGLVTIAINGDSNIQPEDSESFSYGVIFKPRLLQGLRLSADFTEIRKSGEINSPGQQFFIDNEALYPERIQRAGNLSTDPAGWAGPITYINSGPINLLSSTVRSLDLQLDYLLDTPAWGNWRFYAVGTDQLKFGRQISALFAPEDRVGYNDGMVKWRINGGIDWNKGPWSAGWNTQYVTGYSLCYSTYAPGQCAFDMGVLAQGTDRVPSQTYHDATVGYRFDNPAFRALAGADINLGIQNVFDTSPPILGYGLYSGYGDPRLRRFTLTVRKRFGS